MRNNNSLKDDREQVLQAISIIILAIPFDACRKSFIGIGIGIGIGEIIKKNVYVVKVVKAKK